MHNFWTAEIHVQCALCYSLASAFKISFGGVKHSRGCIIDQISNEIKIIKKSIPLINIYIYNYENKAWSYLTISYSSGIAWMF